MNNTTEIEPDRSLHTILEDHSNWDVKHERICLTDRVAKSFRALRTTYNIDAKVRARIPGTRTISERNDGLAWGR